MICKVKEKLDSVDLAKFIASILIIILHSNPLKNYDNAKLGFEILARWCVPIFFIASAYFLFRKSVDGMLPKDALKKYSVRILKLYAVWFVFNIPSIIYTRLYVNDITKIGTWLRFIKNSALSSTFLGSWYLMSSVFSAWLIYYLSKKLSTKKILLVTFAVYLICVLSSAYGLLLVRPVKNVLDFLCFPLNLFGGSFYFALGKFIFENKGNILQRISSTKAAVLFLLSYALYGAEIVSAKRFNVLNTTDMGLFTAAIGFFLFILLLHSDIRIPNSILLRKLSVIIYCSQGNIVLAKSAAARMLGTDSPIAVCLIALTMAAAIAALVLFIQKHSGWRFAKYLT